MRRSSLSHNEFAHSYSQRPAGDLHALGPCTDWADLLRTLLDVPIAVVGGLTPSAGRLHGISVPCDRTEPTRTCACADSPERETWADISGKSASPACPDERSHSVLVSRLRGLMQPDGMTIIPDLWAANPGTEAAIRARTWGVRSLAGLLLTAAGDEEPNVVCVMDRRRRGYTVGELEVLQRVAEIANGHRSLAFSLAAAATCLGEDRAGCAMDTLSVLRELASEESEDAVQRAAEALAAYLGVCALEIHERTGHRRMLRLSAAWGQPGRLLGRRTARMGSCCQADTAMKMGRSIMSEDLGRERGYRTAALLRKIGVGRGISVPIGDGREPVGVVSVYWSLPGAIPSPVGGLIHAVAGCLGAVATIRKAQDGLCRRLGDPAWVGRNLGRHLQTAGVDGNGLILACDGPGMLGETESVPVPKAWERPSKQPIPLLAGALLGPRSQLLNIRTTDHIVRTRDGGRSWYRLIWIPSHDGSVPGCQATLLLTDITDRTLISTLLDAPEKLFPGDATSSNPPVVAVVDEDGNILQSAGDWPGVPHSHLGGVTGTGVDPVFPGECDCGRDTCIRAHAKLSRGIRRVASGASCGFELEFACGPPTGPRRICSRIARIPHAGRKLAAVGLWDITESERKRGNDIPSATDTSGSRSAGEVHRPEPADSLFGRGTEETIAHMSYHDGITGLPNHTLLRDRLDLAVMRARRSGGRLGLLSLDLDRFKILNDSLGRKEGDQLLRLVGRRLVQSVRSGDTVARPGGDEFLILLPDIENTECATRTASKVLESMEQPFRLGGRDAFVTCSMGLSLFPESGDDAEAMIKDADIAMYSAKASGGNRLEMFSPSMTVRTSERFGLEADLHQAIREKEFEVFYQPIYDLDSGIITGAEALVRWRHPTRGLVLPGAFIPVAEETGQIVPIGLDVLRRSFHEIRGLQLRGHPGLRLSVNVSLRQFHQPDFVSQVEQVINETGMNPDEVSLEITESVAMCPMVSCVNTLYGLKTLGLRMSLDDFGQGHSSLTRLKRLPIDAIKIDRAFVRRITLDQRDAAIARAMITMAHSLDLDVTAEGVEECGQLEFLRREGCDAVQGFLLSRPVPLEDLEAMLRDGKRIEESV